MGQADEHGLKRKFVSPISSGFNFEEQRSVFNQGVSKIIKQS
jgi:hypothetical protein